MRTIFNTSFIVDESIEREWTGFMKEKYIPFLRCYPVNDIIFTKVSIDQSEGKTYSLQLVFDSETAMELFRKADLPVVEEQLTAAFGGRYLCFSSVLYEL